MRAILGGAAFYGSNRDGTFPTADGPSPGAGALIAAVEYATGTQRTLRGQAGDRHVPRGAAAARRGSYLMVGDRLDADVAGAHAAGLDAALVLTGRRARRTWPRGRARSRCVVLGSIAELPAYL